MQFKYDNRKPLFDFIVSGNSNAGHICHRFRDIHSGNVHDLDPLNGSRSNVNMPIERPHAIFYVLALAMFDLSLFVRYSHINITIYSIRIFDLENEGQGR